MKFNYFDIFPCAKCDEIVVLSSHESMNNYIFRVIARNIIRHSHMSANIPPNHHQNPHIPHTHTPTHAQKETNRMGGNTIMNYFDVTSVWTSNEL